MEQRPIRLVYDMSVLGAGTMDNLSRTGIFRVAENSLLRLAQCNGLELGLFASPEFFEAARTYLSKHPALNGLALRSRSELEKALPGGFDIFHSPFYPIPRSISEQRLISRFLTIYDLIPVKFPHFFTAPGVTQFKDILSSITRDTRIFCISHSTKSDLCEHLDFVDPDNVYVTHLAAASQFHVITDNELIAAAKRKYGIPDAPYILTLSTLEPRKNIETTIQAFLDLIHQEKAADVNLVLVGSKGWKIDSLIEKYTKDRTLKGRLIFTGFVHDEDLAPLYCGSSAFVYPSHYEGFGLPPLEAMQCGVPVITSNNSSLPEVVGDAGILINADDKDALCQSILDVLDSDELQLTMHKKSLEQAQKFSWEKHMAVMVGAYGDAPLNRQEAVTAKKTGRLRIGINFTHLIPGKIGGMEKYMRALVHYLPRLSAAHEFYVFLRPEYADEIEEAERVKRVCIDKVPMPHERDSAIHREVKHLGIDVWLSPLLILDPLTLNIPSLYCVPDLQHEYYPEFFSRDVLNWRGKYFKKSAETADAVLTISDFSKQTIVEKYRISPDKIHVTWLDCPTYFSLDKAIEHESYVREAYQLPEQFVFFPANTWAHKNHATLFRALECYDRIYGNPPALVLTGYESDAHEHVSAAIENRKRSFDIQFLGYVPEDLMPAIYHCATCLVFPSMFEGFGIPLVEAMRSNCPIIAANNTTMREIAGDAAAYFNTMDEVELAVLMRYVLTDQRLRTFLINNGASRAKLFSFEQCMRQTLSVIEEVARGKCR